MYARILVAIDGSELSTNAVEKSVQFARTLGSELVYFSVVEGFPTVYVEGGLATAEQIVEIEKALKDRAQGIVDAACTKAKVLGVSCQGVIANGQVADAIVEQAKALRCDLIMMASHGRRGLERLLLGSETQHVLTHTHIPVLVLR